MSIQSSTTANLQSQMQAYLQADQLAFSQSMNQTDFGSASASSNSNSSTSLLPAVTSTSDSYQSLLGNLTATQQTQYQQIQTQLAAAKATGEKFVASLSPAQNAQYKAIQLLQGKLANTTAAAQKANLQAQLDKAGTSFAASLTTTQQGLQSASQNAFSTLHQSEDAFFNALSATSSNGVYSASGSSGSGTYASLAQSLQSKAIQSLLSI